jgi:Cu/Ag efflux protein CusF
MLKKTAFMMLIPVLALLLITLAGTGLVAQGHDHGGHGGHGMSGMSPAPEPSPAPPATPPEGPSAVLVSRGVVKQISPSAGTVVLDHDPIPELNWERMVMEFQVEDPTLLEEIAAGDTVRFDLKVTGMGPNASMIITDLEEVE